MSPSATALAQPAAIAPARSASASCVLRAPPARSLALTKPHAEMRLQHARRAAGRAPASTDSRRSRRRAPSGGCRRRRWPSRRSPGWPRWPDRCASRRVASRPSRSLIFRSMKMTSGRCSRASSIASTPPAAVITLTPALSSRLARMRRFAVLSSTTSAVTLLAWRQPRVERRQRDVVPVALARRRRAAATSGSVKQNRLPSPGTLSTCELAAHLPDQMIADRQAEPGAAGGRAALRLRERLEDLRQRLGLDADARCRSPRSAGAGRRPQRSPAAPRRPRVNLMALPSRLSSTWRRCRPSSTTPARHVVGDRHRQPQPFALGRFGDDVR